MKLGKAIAFRDLAIFVVVFAALLALKRHGFADVTGYVGLALVLSGSLYLAWKTFRARDNTQWTRRWGAVMPPKVWRWMIGEDEPPSTRR